MGEVFVSLVMRSQVLKGQFVMAYACTRLNSARVFDVRQEERGGVGAIGLSLIYGAVFALQARVIRHAGILETLLKAP